MRISIFLTLVLATASTVLGQPGMMNPMQGVGFGLPQQQQLGLGQQQVSFVPMMQQQQRPLNYPIVGQQQLGNIGGFNYPIQQQQQPIYPSVGQVGLGNIGQVGTAGQANPLWNNIAQGWSNLGQQQLLGNVGATTGIPLNYGGATTIPAVLPQNYGNPSASFGTLAQPVLSPQQIQQIVPTAQLQAALDQRVHGFGQVQQGQPIAFGNQGGLGLGMGNLGGLQQQPFIGA